jgi:hypothetical protein
MSVVFNRPKMAVKQFHHQRTWQSRSEVIIRSGTIDFLLTILRLFCVSVAVSTVDVFLTNRKSLDHSFRHCEVSKSGNDLLTSSCKSYRFNVRRMFNKTEMAISHFRHLCGILSRKWHHQSICGPRLPMSGPLKFSSYLVPFKFCQ